MVQPTYLTKHAKTCGLILTPSKESQEEGKTALCRSHFKLHYWRMRHGNEDWEELSRWDVERTKEDMRNLDSKRLKLVPSERSGGVTGRSMRTKDPRRLGLHGIFGRDELEMDNA